MPLGIGTLKEQIWLLANGISDELPNSTVIPISTKCVFVNHQSIKHGTAEQGRVTNNSMIPLCPFLPEKVP